MKVRAGEAEYKSSKRKKKPKQEKKKSLASRLGLEDVVSEEVLKKLEIANVADDEEDDDADRVTVIPRSRRVEPTYRERQETDAYMPEGLPDHFFNKEGELDLSGVTGEEARRYFQAIGIKLPIIGGVVRSKLGFG